MEFQLFSNQESFLHHSLLTRYNKGMISSLHQVRHLLSFHKTFHVSISQSGFFYLSYLLCLGIIYCIYSGSDWTKSSVQTSAVKIVDGLLNWCGESLTEFLNEHSDYRLVYIILTNWQSCLIMSTQQLQPTGFKSQNFVI